MTANTACVIPAPDGDLFGVLARPAAATDRGVLLLPGGGYTFSPQRNRWGVRLAESLAARGWATLRFDWHGIGDSAGEASHFELNSPFPADAAAAAAKLADEGIDRWVAVGNCFGARSALTLDHPGMIGAVLISPPVRDSARGEGTATRAAQDLTTTGFLSTAAHKVRLTDLTDPARRRRAVRILRSFATARRHRHSSVDPTPWASERFLTGIGRLVASGTPILILYGETDSDFGDFQAAGEGRLGELLERGKVEVVVAEGSLHGLTTLDAQNVVIDRVIEWVDGMSGKQGGR